MSTTPVLNAKTAARVERHAKKCNISPEYALNRMVNAWLDDTGDAIAARIAAKRKASK